MELVELNTQWMICKLKNVSFKKLTWRKIMKASDLFIKCLENEGVERIFGVPGEENADFMMSLKKSKKIKYDY